MIQVLSDSSEVSARIDLQAAVAESLGGVYLDDVQVRAAYLAGARWLGHHHRASIESGISKMSAKSSQSGASDSNSIVLDIALELARARSGTRNLASDDIVWLGCRHYTSRAIERDVVLALQRGATVVASDLSADIEPFRSLLRPDGPNGPRLARAMFSCDHGSDRALPFVPAIRLPAGHLRLTSDVERVAGCRVIARDAHTSDPLAVVLPVLRGHLIFSSAHWLQSEPVDMSAAGRRPLFATPVYEEIGHHFPFVSVGEFHAAVAMLSMLSAGLSITWQGWTKRSSADTVTSLEDASRRSGWDDAIS